LEKEKKAREPEMGNDLFNEIPRDRGKESSNGTGNGKFKIWMNLADQRICLDFSGRHCPA
jgi:hypothetical protein